MQCRNGYNTTLRLTTWSAKRHTYAVLLHWMRHRPNRASHNWKASRTNSVTTKIESLLKLHQCESYSYSRMRLWWCYSNAHCFPTADRQCATLLLIFETQLATSFEIEATALSAELTHPFSGQYSAACSAICTWFVRLLILGRAVPSTIHTGLLLWLLLDLRWWNHLVKFASELLQRLFRQ